MTHNAPRLNPPPGFFSTDALNTPERLAVLHDDPHAGFLPPTYLEINQALTILDYADEVPLKRGLHQGLMEIYDHQKKLYQRKENEETGKPLHSSHQAGILAHLAVASVLHTFGDHLADARTVYPRLSVMRKVVGERINPNLSVAAAFNDAGIERGIEKFAPLQRYVDIVRYMIGQKMPGFDPLRTKTERLARVGSGAYSHTQSGGERFNVSNVLANKHVGSYYTAPKLDKQLADYLSFMFETVAIGDLVDDCDKVLVDVRNRGKFWRRVLDNVGYTYNDLASTIVATRIGEGKP